MAKKGGKRKKAKKGKRVKELSPEEQSEKIKADFENISSVTNNAVQAATEKWEKQKLMLPRSIKHTNYIKKNVAIEHKRKEAGIDWENFFKCDGFPHNYTNKELNEYISRLIYETKSELSIPRMWPEDEKFAYKLQHYKEKPKPPKLGDKVEKKIIDVVKIVKMLRRILEGKKDYIQHVDLQLIRDFKTKLQTALKDYIDIYTFEILCNKEMEMEEVDEVSAAHNYKNYDFGIGLWLLSNVPQPNRELYQTLVIPLTAINCEITIPYVPVMENTAIRGFWTIFDFYSRNSPNFFLKEMQIQNLYVSNKQEREAQLLIQDHINTELKQKFSDFQKAIEVFVESQQEKKDGKKGDKKKERKKEGKAKKEKKKGGDKKKKEKKKGGGKKGGGKKKKGASKKEKPKKGKEKKDDEKTEVDKDGEGGKIEVKKTKKGLDKGEKTKKGEKKEGKKKGEKQKDKNKTPETKKGGLKKQKDKNKKEANKQEENIQEPSVQKENEEEMINNKEENVAKEKLNEEIPKEENSKEANQTKDGIVTEENAKEENPEDEASKKENLQEENTQAKSPQEETPTEKDPNEEKIEVIADKEIIDIAENNEENDGEENKTERLKAGAEKGKKKGGKKKKKKGPKLGPMDFGNPLKHNPVLIFLEREEEEYKSLLDGSIPALRPFDINLRSHNILGGVFTFDCNEKTSQRRDFILKEMKLTLVNLPKELKPAAIQFVENTEENTDAVELELDDKKTSKEVINEKQNTTNEEKEKDTPETKADSQIVKTKSETQNELKKDGKKASESYDIIFKFKLPEGALWFEEPIVCYWEPWEESEEFKNYDEETKELYTKRVQYFKRPEKEKQIPLSYNQEKMKIIPDFDLSNIPIYTDFYELCKDYVMPVLPYHFQTHIDNVLERQEKLKTRKIQALLAGSASDEDLKFSNFQQNNIDITVHDPCPLFPFNVKSPGLLILDEPYTPSPVEIEEHKVNPEFSDSSSVLSLTKSEDEFTPPKIKFSEYYAAIQQEAEDEQPIFKAEQADNVNKKSNIRYRKSRRELLPVAKSAAIFDKTKSVLIEDKQKSIMTLDKVKSTAKFKSNDAFNFDMNLHSEHFETPNKSFINPVDAQKEEGEHEYFLGRWCTKDIYIQQYDPETQTISFQSPNLGVYAVAVYKYYHMPYKTWLLKPNSEYTAVIFALETRVFPLEIEITSKGFVLRIPGPLPNNVPIPNEPLGLEELKDVMCSLGVNIFPERDAANYIFGVTEKHLPMEFHSYYAIAHYCLSFRFKFSLWNRYSERRKAVLMVEDARFELPYAEHFEVLITPFDCLKVRITEECSDNLNDIKLNYNPLPAWQEIQPDLFFLLKTALRDRENPAEDDIELQWNISQLLTNIRPLSFS